ASSCGSSTGTTPSRWPRPRPPGCWRRATTPRCPTSRCRGSGPTSTTARSSSPAAQAPTTRCGSSPATWPSAASSPSTDGAAVSSAPWAGTVPATSSSGVSGWPRAWTTPTPSTWPGASPDMTSLAWALLALTLVIAALDWVAKGIGSKPMEYVFKPLTMVALIGVALALDPTDAGARSAFVVALVFGMAGDVFLMLPDDKRWFVFGLGSFLVGHLAYVVGLV